MAVTGKHLHVAIRAYRVARCHPLLQPIPTCSIVEHQMTGVPGRDVAVVPVARHRCVYDDCHALFDANHHISAGKALSASHAQRSGAMVLAAGAWWHGVRPV
ncbi:MAG: hypothetical protein K6G32_12505 [Prevotella sp.]|nr:hypothetical protein [Prevotella sp.]